VLAVSSHLKKQANDAGLCIWQCDWKFKNKDPVLAYVENSVTAALLGPKLPYPIWGSGKTADEAVENALSKLEARQRTQGLLGALARLEAAVGDLTYKLRAEGWRIGPDALDDDVPF
jgi:hypothetical protein